VLLFRYRIIWIFSLCFFSTAAFFPIVANSSSQLFWQKEDVTCYGNLACMLKQVEVSERIPHLRTKRSAQTLIGILKKAGRFQQLGLTDREGEILVDAVYRKMGLNLGSHPGAISTENQERIIAAPEISYRAGQEFEKLDGVLMRWPFDWESQKDEWAEMIAAMSNAEVTLYIWVNKLSQQLSATRYLVQMGVPTEHIVWVIEATNSVWMRDYGPQFIYNTNSDGWGVADFHYYDSRPQDDDTPVFISRVCRVPRVNRQTEQVVYTEGGNLNHDGLGCVVYSERTYNGNPGVETETIDQRILSAFQAHLNLVPEDPSLDGTGHVDMFMKIVRENTVLVAEYEPDQVDYQVLEDCAELFENSTNGAGQPWNVVRIPQPDVYYIFFVLPVVRTYTNSLMVNDTVLLPVYDIPLDNDAVAVYQEVLPGKTIYPIDASVIIESGGAWHCVTMEYPSPSNPG
jgi:agmatine deiminase